MMFKEPDYDSFSLLEKITGGPSSSIPGDDDDPNDEDGDWSDVDDEDFEDMAEDNDDLHAMELENDILDPDDDDHLPDDDE